MFRFKRSIFIYGLTLYFLCLTAQQSFGAVHRLMDDPSTGELETEFTKNEVIMLGLIHNGHLTSEKFSLPFLKQLIKDINPDYVLTEIPPDRLAEAAAGFAVSGEVTEARVSRFPEYKDVLFPLTKEMDFRIIPTAGWTQGMADYRRDALQQISQDPARADDWQEYQAANAKRTASIDGRGDDPSFIHSVEYDAITKAGLTLYATLFVNDLGRGDWERINQAHYSLIEAALDHHENEGARILITFGAGHKYWFLEQLEKREDIILINPKEFFDGARAKIKAMSKKSEQ